ncbi:hypothetical protein GQ44DRAFT_606869 [Phaeosphaeriaceae sp. PMI808]|nr:hypothetical protein GQ44DRAFT_606869 [Phaeosphaeriaceae sp. PMI808]
MATQQAVRRWIMTAAVAGVTITGTIYGASLKGDQDVQKEKKRILEATPEERIAQLEVARADLVLRKNEMERKIATFHRNQKDRDQEQVDPK